MDDPNFAHAVVLVLLHTIDGAFGLILNDESSSHGIDITDLVGPAWSALVAPPESIFIGGPCETSSVIALGLTRSEDADLDAESTTISVVDLSQNAPDESIERVRLFAGYAGWAPMQLDAELERSGWFVADSVPADTFSPAPLDLWETVLKRNGEPYARFPTDPRLN
jgi:putative transcriptional regulator